MVTTRRDLRSTVRIRVVIYPVYPLYRTEAPGPIRSGIQAIRGA
jgi:hypothetical protein